MRSLLMLRHAKSDWQVDYGGDDRLRPLAKRGRRAARSVGRFLAVTGQVPDLAIASPALRATQTLDLARLAGRWACAVETADDLYGGPEEVLGTVRRRGGDAATLLIVGHQPTWSAVASELTGGARLALPTASLLRLDFDVDDWRSVEGPGRVRYLVTARMLEKAVGKRRS